MHMPENQKHVTTQYLLMAGYQAIPHIQRVVCIKQLCAVFAGIDVYEGATRVLWYPGGHIIHFVSYHNPAV